jgi:hypothetical protein
MIFFLRIFEVLEFLPLQNLGLLCELCVSCRFVTKLLKFVHRTWNCCVN